LVKRESDDSALVLKEVTEPKVVAAVVSAITAQPSDAQLDRIKRIARWQLNRAAQIDAGVWRGKLKLEDLEDFKEQVQTLAQYPSLYDEFFVGKPEVWIDEGHTELHVQNADTNLIDPARFIKNAKPLALVPFDLKKETPVKKETIEKLPGYKLWKGTQPRRRSSSSAPTEEESN
jgi:hypothetical protein